MTRSQTVANCEKTETHIQKQKTLFDYFYFPQEKTWALLYLRKNSLVFRKEHMFSFIFKFSGMRELGDSEKR